VAIDPCCIARGITTREDLEHVHVTCKPSVKSIKRNIIEDDPDLPIFHLLINRRWVENQIKDFESDRDFDLSKFIIAMCPSYGVEIKVSNQVDANIKYAFLNFARIMPRFEKDLMRKKFHRDHVMHQVKVAFLMEYILKELWKTEWSSKLFPELKAQYSLSPPPEIIDCYFLAGFFHDVGLPIREISSKFESASNALGRDLCNTLAALYYLPKLKDVDKLWEKLRNLDLNEFLFKEHVRITQKDPEIILSLLKAFSIPILIRYLSPEAIEKGYILPAHTPKQIRMWDNSVKRHIHPVKGSCYFRPRLSLIHKVFTKLTEGYQLEDHGILGALLLAQNMVPLPAAQAIAHHNLANLIIDDLGFPLSCLLIICDELQEWSRPFSQDPTVKTMESIELDVRESTIEAVLDYRKSINLYKSPWRFEKTLRDKITNLGRVTLNILNFSMTIIDPGGSKYKIFKCPQCDRIISDHKVDIHFRVKPQNSCPYCK